MIDLRKFDSAAAREWRRGEHGDAEHLICDGAPVATVERDHASGFAVLDHVNDTDADGFETMAEAREFAMKQLDRRFAEIKAA